MWPPESYLTGVDIKLCSLTFADSSDTSVSFNLKELHAILRPDQINCSLFIITGVTGEKKKQILFNPV